AISIFRECRRVPLALEVWHRLEMRLMAPANNRRSVRTFITETGFLGNVLFFRDISPARKPEYLFACIILMLGAIGIFCSRVAK
ncbi:hypothetical protein ON021_12410, partial [Microcoleus sp. HI-ES]|nr:hypothetical protein [Microcoleus sp. HI-ES]